MASLSYDDLTGMLALTAEKVLQHIDELNLLDTRIGDGDHGTTMHRVMTSLQKTLAEDTSLECKKVLDDIGWNMMSQDGGSAGMLMGAFFMGMSSGVQEGLSQPKAFSAILRAGAENFCKNSGAHIGEKTMLDAMLPAIDAFEESVHGGVSTAAAFGQAAIAAQAGAEATRDMLPTRGRAKNLGEKALGVCDPGATSMALIFGAFNQYWQEKNNG